MELRGTAGAARARMRALLVASGLGLVQTGWAAFQWYELLVARAGGQVVCIGGGGHCADVWDSPFASLVHARTGLPVAAWGVAFGLVALALPLVARIRLARRRAAEAWLGATFVAAIAGVAGAAVLLTASLQFGHLCTTCATSYLLALGYAAAAFWATGLPVPAALARGAPLALALIGVAWLVLLVPGRRTPQNTMAAGARAIAAAPGAGVGSTPEEREISAFIASLPAEARQSLSDTLASYAASGEFTLPPARVTIGAPMPRIELTEFTDTLCAHCKQLHETLLELRRRFGESAFSVAPHQYPLDPTCNANIPGDKEPEPLRCLAARLQICAEGKPGQFDFVGKLFENQSALSEAMAWQLAAPLGPRAELEACVKSPDTEAKLQSDIAWAAKHGISGTPFLFVGRRQAIAYPPLLYVLALTRGASSNPAFAVLPPPQPLPFPVTGHP